MLNKLRYKSGIGTERDREREGEKIRERKRYEERGRDTLRDRIAKDGETVYLKSTNWVRISCGCDLSGVERIFTSKE